MTSLIPQLIVTLTATGELAVELPGSQGTRRKVTLRVSEAGASLVRMLEAQAREGAEIGLDGAPTVAQVRHWERHSIGPSTSCRFCIAEGRAKPDFAKHRAKAPAALIDRRADGVEIKRVAPGTSGLRKHKTNQLSPSTAAKLGL